MSSIFDIIQTFYVDKDRANGASSVMLTSVEVFFKAKPSLIRNISGSIAPGVSIWICPVINGQPAATTILKDSTSYLGYDLIATSDNASAGTVFSFRNPISLQTTQTYGIVIKYDDPAFDIWINKQGDRLVGINGATNVASPGSLSRFTGNFYKGTNSGDLTEFSDRDLKFKINVAKFSTTNTSIVLVNKDYEFFTIGSTLGNFRGGEMVYQETANASGNITMLTTSADITGIGTTFEDYLTGQKVLLDNGTYRDIFTITNIANNTTMTLDKMPNFESTTAKLAGVAVGQVHYINYSNKELILVNSNARTRPVGYTLPETDYKFNVGTRVRGLLTNASANVTSIDKKTVDKFIPKFKIGSPSTAKYSITYKLSNSSNNIFPAYSNLDLYKENVLKENSYILSRSTEIDGTNLYGDRKKSAVANVYFQIVAENENIFSVPFIDGDELDFFIYNSDVNNDYLEDRYGIEDYDTEIDRNGIAKSKYVTKKINFAANRLAEDLIVYLTAYKPYTTDIRVYAKLYNTFDNETYDDKAWTPLELKNGIDKYSRTHDGSDFIEYTYGLPKYPDVLTEDLNITLTIADYPDLDTPSNIIQTNINPTSVGLAQYDLIRLYDKLIPENHEVYLITALGATSITVNRPVNNRNIGQNPNIDKLKYKTTAFNNAGNDNIVRYYTSDSYQEIDNFNSMQLKVVMLANNSYIVPKIEQLQAIGVSA